MLLALYQFGDMVKHLLFLIANVIYRTLSIFT